MILLKRSIENGRALGSLCAILIATALPVLHASHSGTDTAAPGISPKVFTIFEEAVDHAKAREQYVLVAYLKKNKALKGETASFPGT